MASFALALCSALVAAIAVRITTKNADRQFALSQVQDVNKWSADVMTSFRAVHGLFGGPYGGAKSFEEKGKDCNSIIGELFYNKDLSAFLFPADKTEPQLWLEKMISAVFAFQTQLFSNEMLSHEHSTLVVELREGFIESVRCELQLRKRYNDVMRYLRK